jgi:hypothetical protein
VSDSVFVRFFCVHFVSALVSLSLSLSSSLTNRQQEPMRKASRLDNRFSIGQSATIARSLLFFSFCQKKAQLRKGEKSNSLSVDISK